jgi:hypothetical protein
MSFPVVMVARLSGMFGFEQRPMAFAEVSVERWCDMSLKAISTSL